MNEENEITEDIKQARINQSTDKLLKEIKRETDWFTDEMDIYKVAVAVALAKDFKPSKPKRGIEGGAQWRVVLLDPDQKLKRIIELMAPDCGQTPYRYSEALAMAGISYLHNELVTRARSIGDALHIQEIGGDS